MAGMASTPTGRFAAHFPYGEFRTVPSQQLAIRRALAADHLDVAALDLPETPEPPRAGEDGADCDQCAASDTDYLWTDDHWRISTFTEPRALFFILIYPREHHQELPDLPAEQAAELGPLLARTETALRSLGDVGRVHTHKWGDGAAHLHLWQIVRPEGMLQANGVSAPVWLGAMPPLPTEVWEAARRDFARAMAQGGGTAHC